MHALAETLRVEADDMSQRLDDAAFFVREKMNNSPHPPASALDENAVTVGMLELTHAALSDCLERMERLGLTTDEDTLPNDDDSAVPLDSVAPDNCPASEPEVPLKVEPKVLQPEGSLEEAPKASEPESFVQEEPTALNEPHALSPEGSLKAELQVLEPKDSLMEDVAESSQPASETPNRKGHKRKGFESPNDPDKEKPSPKALPRPKPPLLPLKPKSKPCPKRKEKNPNGGKKDHKNDNTKIKKDKQQADHKNDNTKIKKGKQQADQKPKGKSLQSNKKDKGKKSDGKEITKKAHSVSWPEISKIL